MTQNKTINSQIEDEEYLDEKFPKGMSKLRGEAMVLLALARRRGKQEAQKMFSFELKRLIIDIEKHWDKVVNPKENVLRELKELLQKADEIFNHSQTRQSKETSVEKGGDKAERYLFNSDNVSSADTLKLNHNCPICDKEIFLGDDTVNEKGIVYHLGCYLFKNHFTINDSLKDTWDNPEDDRWDKEYDSNLLPKTLRNKREDTKEDRSFLGGYAEYVKEGKE